MANIRTFTAVDISDSIRSAAGRLIARIAVDGADYRWVEKENLHVTLNFLGDVPETEIPTVCRVIKDAVSEFKKFELHVRGTGCFPLPEKPRVVWLGIGSGTSELTALNKRIEESLEPLRFPPDRKDYSPHLTLGRIRRGGHWNPEIIDAVAKHSKLDAGRSIVKDVVVYSSFLDKTGPSYTAMSRIPLL